MKFGKMNIFQSFNQVLSPKHSEKSKRKGEFFNFKTYVTTETYNAVSGNKYLSQSD